MKTDSGDGRGSISLNRYCRIPAPLERHSDLLPPSIQEVMRRIRSTLEPRNSAESVLHDQDKEAADAQTDTGEDLALHSTSMESRRSEVPVTTTPGDLSSERCNSPLADDHSKKTDGECSTTDRKPSKSSNKDRSMRRQSKEDGGKQQVKKKTSGDCQSSTTDRAQSKSSDRGLEGQEHEEAVQGRRREGTGQDKETRFLHGYKHSLHVVHTISHSLLPQLNWNCLCCHSEWNDHSLFCYLAKGLLGVLSQLVLLNIFVYVTVCLFLIQYIDYLIFLNQAYLLCFHFWYIHCG